MEKYECGNCGEKVKLGTNYCNNCGYELVWESKKARKPMRTIRLPINPENLSKIVDIETFSSFKPYKIAFLFSFFGPLLCIIIGVQESKIRKWFYAIRTKNTELSIFEKYVKKIKACGIWSVFLNAIFIIINVILFTININEITAGNPPKYNVWLSSPLTSGAGIAVGVYVIEKANNILKDISSKTKYLYEFEE